MLGVGIVGAGFFGRVHARAITRHPALRIAGICGWRQAADLATQYDTQVYRDWQALLTAPDIDAVVVATPHHLHAEVAVAALEAGKHVLLEKPMAPTVAECRRIEAVAARSSALLSVGHVMHYSPPLMVARQLIGTAGVGQPVTGTSRLVKLWMETNRRPWHLDASTGGGMLLTAGIHALDQLVWLMAGNVASVTAMAGTFFHEQAVDDAAHLGLRFIDGRIAQMTSVGYRDGAVTSSLEIVCEDAVLAIDLRAGRIRLGRGATWTDLEVPGGADGTDEAVSREWSAFADAVSTGVPPIAPAYGRHLVAIIEAAAEANRLHREVEIED